MLNSNCQKDVDDSPRCVDHDTVRAEAIIFLINNGGYTTEVEIHGSHYSIVKNWDFTGLVDAICNGEGKCWMSKVFKEEQLIKAIQIATGVMTDNLCFMEVMIHKGDASKELLLWGSRVSAANSRLPSTMNNEEGLWPP
ncbi:unnamed protein product [Thlaspi arvense]|uniref:pyruvate decarboxylase n=1 Tax=Thlaspi arvense TaxID=13288 RepID=A0AAU9RLB2_THLAR|nr:unnamed protein product [Thlaspi arvense]